MQNHLLHFLCNYLARSVEEQEFVADMGTAFRKINSKGTHVPILIERPTKAKLESDRGGCPLPLSPPISVIQNKRTKKNFKRRKS